MSAYSEAVAEVGGLSSPSKLPCKSWSTPAYRCIVGSLLAKQPGTICSKCYARKGMYMFPNVVAAMERRFKRLQAALNSPGSESRFAEAFATIMHERWGRTVVQLHRKGRMGRDDGRYFRWHDSGDLHGLQHLKMLNRIAIESPHTKFWLPTKEVGVVETYLKTFRLAGNLMVRLSLPRIGMELPERYRKLDSLSRSIAMAGAHTVKPEAGFEQCNAVYTDHECQTCRACWTHKPVSYTVI